MAEPRDTFVDDRRAALWTALGDLYLDNEMQSFTHEAIARTIIAQGYTLEQARRIDREEVFPVLHDNLLSVAGEWMGFANDWLIDEIAATARQRGPLGRWWNELLYACFGSMMEADWQAIELAYGRLRSPTAPTPDPRQ